MVFGALALFFVLSTISVQELNDGRPGLVSYFVSNVVIALTPDKAPITEPTMSPIGIFPLTEKQEKRLLVYTSIAFVVLSLLLALVSEKYGEFNLYYAGGVLASFCALVFVSILLTLALIVPTLVALLIFRKSRKKPNKRTQIDAATPRD